MASVVVVFGGSSDVEDVIFVVMKEVDKSIDFPSRLKGSMMVSLPSLLLSWMIPAGAYELESTDSEEETDLAYLETIESIHCL